MLKINKKGLLIVISGPSGAGKDTICQKLINECNNLYLSISMTTRKPRNTEISGKDYFFVTKDEFEENIKNNIFLEYAIYNNNYYGTPKDKVEEMINKGQDVILVIDIKGAINIQKIIPSALFIFIMLPNPNGSSSILYGLSLFPYPSLYVVFAFKVITGLIS